MALINKLNDIGDAIRAKTGKEDKLTLEQMVTEIAAIEGGSGGVEVEPIVLTGAQSYGCSGDIATAYIKLFGDSITTSNLTDTNYMFSNSKLEYIPFELNYSGGNYDIARLFFNCSNLKEIPKMNNAMPQDTNNIFKGCKNIREIPLECFNTWDWSYIEKQTSTYSGNRSSQFQGCYSLRSAPKDFLNHINKNTTYLYSIYYDGFHDCYTLNEMVEMPVYSTATWTSNGFVGCVSYCNRLKNFTFSLQEDNTPYIVKWKNQVIDLTTSVGYLNWTGKDSTIPSEDLTEAQRETVSSLIIDYNSGITIDKMVYDEASYQALKDDPDWYYVRPAAGDTEPYYSRYNHDSAVATINSLPDTSAYLASAGGTNTIKFKGDSGSKTDGGAINTLTEEEIAVAAAKGWTVTLV